MLHSERSVTLPLSYLGCDQEYVENCMPSPNKSSDTSKQIGQYLDDFEHCLSFQHLCAGRSQTETEQTGHFQASSFIRISEVL